MKNRFLFFFILSSFTLWCQTTIKGTIYDKNGVLENVAVYLNNTMFGTTTDVKGEFELQVKDGQYELIVSYLGYKKIVYSLNTSNYTKPLTFVLEEEENVLDEIVIKKIVYDEEWKYNLQAFKDGFLGRTSLSKDCEIINEEVIFFDFNRKDNKLEAFAKKPLKIKHKALGYIITFELESFVRTNDYITYLGYTRYEEMKGGNRKQKRWKKNRLIAYKGSQVHFYKSLINDTFTKEGYIINQFKRVENPERPTEQEIQKARELLRLNRNFNLDFSKKIVTPLTALDSALVTVRKARLPKFKDYLYKSKLKKDEVISFKNNTNTLTFDNNLSVVYTNEKEEEGYILRNVFSKKREATYQTSSIIPLEKNIVLDKSGILIKPLSIFYEGYWSYEKFAHALPLDYEPTY